MIRTLAALTLLASLGLLAACSNTLEGAGRDIEHAGQTIQDNF